MQGNLFPCQMLEMALFEAGILCFMKSLLKKSKYKNPNILIAVISCGKRLTAWLPYRASTCSKFKINHFTKTGLLLSISLSKILIVRWGWPRHCWPLKDCCCQNSWLAGREALFLPFSWRKSCPGGQGCSRKGKKLHSVQVEVQTQACLSVKPVSF